MSQDPSRSFRLPTGAYDMESTNLLVKRLDQNEENMHSSVKELANAIWDSVADRLPGDDNGYYDPDAIVARALGIPKWHAIAARRGYRKPEPPRNITLPRVSILERPYVEESTSHAA